MKSTQLSFFEELQSDPPEPIVQSEDEVFAMARKHFGLPERKNGNSPTPPPAVQRQMQLRTERAARRGLTAKWSKTFGYIALHDPTTGEWWDVPTKSAPAWAKWESFKRKELWHAGDRSAYDLTSAQMRRVWDEEHPATEDEGIIEDHPIEEEVISI